MRTVRGVTLLSVVALTAGLLAAPASAQQDETPTDPGEVPTEAGVAPGVGVPDPRPGEAFADPKVAQLQNTATDVQEELSTLSERISTADDRLSKATKDLSEARSEREAAEKSLKGMQGDIDELSRSAYTGMGRPNELELMLTSTDAKDFLEASSVVSYIRDGQDRKLQRALKRHRAAVQAEDKALGLEKKAGERKEELDKRHGDARNRADAISSELRNPIDSANSAVVAQQEEQEKRNSKTKKSWEDYVDRLADADVTPPRAGSLRDPESLPGDLHAVDGDDGDPQAGVARTTADGKRLLVLPKETVDAVSAAVEELGKPYVPREHGEGPKSYSCDGLVRSVFSDAGLSQPEDIAEQYATGKRVPAKDVQPGDLVFVGPQKYGVQHVGIALDDENMLAADGRLATVAVTDMPAGDSLLGVTRPALGTGPERDTPSRDSDELTWRCGGVELPANVGGSGDGGGSGGADGSDGSDGSADSPGAAGAWGGYPNGLIPPAALCGIGSGNHALRCDAAQAYVELAQAFEEASGDGMCITDSYRAFESQVDLYRRKPDLAAVPGTSNHGWGIAVDLCGGIESFDTPQYRWMVDNASRFGWVNPDWARQGGGREEPWHWEYVGTAG